MAVLKSRQSQSPFKVFDYASEMRRTITNFLLGDFGYSPPLVPNPYESMKQRRHRERMVYWFVKKRRDAVDDCMARLIRYITIANKIYPTCEAELAERRLYQDKAIGECYVLEQELQYCMEVLPVSAKKYFCCADFIAEEIKLIKAWRKSDNKFKTKIKE